MVTAHEVLELAGKFLAERHPGAVLTAAVLAGAANGKVIQLPLLVMSELPPEPRPARKPLRVRILEVLEAAGKPLKGSTVAHRMGHKYDGNLRGALSALKKNGVIGGGGHEGGYFLVKKAAEGSSVQTAPEVTGPGESNA